MLGLKKCPECGALYGADDKVCTKCGRDLISMTFRGLWKSIPCWLKGGIIGAIPLLLLTPLRGLLKGSAFFMIPYIIIVQIPLIIIPLPRNLSRVLASPGFLPFSSEPTIYGYIFVLLFWILIGKLIGWVIDKIKARKK